MYCTVRTVCSIECDLEDAYLDLRYPKANGRRDGSRDEEGDKTLRNVFGINFAPIIEQAQQLLAEAGAIRLSGDAIEEYRSEIRQSNKKIRQISDAEALEESNSILPNVRSFVVKDLAAVEEIRDALKVLENAFRCAARKEESSDQTEDFDVLTVQTKETKFLHEPYQVSKHVTVQQAVAIAAEPFRECLEMYGDYTWQSLTNSAYEIARSIGIDDRTGGAACDNAVLGPERTAPVTSLATWPNGWKSKT